MADATEIPWGDPIAEPDFNQHGGNYVRALRVAAERDPSFEVLGWRRVACADGSPQDYFVVDANDGSIPGRNLVGIRRRERLALGYWPGAAIPLDVRALRADFPDVLHVNAVGANEPRSLCMYDDAWSSVERTWTPQAHLARILWWLRHTAAGTLHAPDQPLEPAYYASPLKLILPQSMRSGGAAGFPALRLTRLSGSPTRLPIVVRGSADASAAPIARAEGVDFLTLRVAPVETGVIRHFPPNLRALQEDFAAMGSDLIGPLRALFFEHFDPKGAEKLGRAARMFTLIVVAIPRLREGFEESTEVRGFLVDCDALSLGLGCAALRIAEDRRVYRDIPVTAAVEAERRQAGLAACATLAIAPVEVQFELNAAGARHFSGIEEATADFRGILIGVGALGGLLADIWAREGWGQWDYVDDDVLLPHNVVRHLGGNAALGGPKAHIVRQLAGFSDAPDSTGSQAFVEAFGTKRSADLAERVHSSALIVDASTTLYVARDALDDEGQPRLATVFLTPSGLASVLMLDSADRAIRVAQLEPQYYRAIMRNDWGRLHLQGHGGRAWVAGGCRRTSAALSNELVHAHAGLLARQLRRSKEQPNARLCVWTLDDATGELRVAEANIATPVTRSLGEWRIIWDEEVQTRITALRANHLPSETGGIVLGYIDQKLRALFVVDVLPSPPDSEADESGFTRGKEGVLDAIEECRRRTGGVVDYVGEWHSHPRACSVMPSPEDFMLLGYLVELREKEGLPTVMLIVGDDALSISFVHGSESLA